MADPDHVAQVSTFDVIAVLITLAAAFSYVNYRFLKLPSTIGLMLLALVFSLGLTALGQFSPQLILFAQDFVNQIDFNKALMNCMLSFLLFAGALHINLSDLAEQKRVIAILASVGVVLSTFIVGTVVYYLLGAFGLSVSYLYCLLFGALISPTDPIAVLGILRKVGAPKTLETKITGESLFNDGVGVVVFVALLGLVNQQLEASPASIAGLFLKEAGGGVVIGAGLGIAA
ncbi:MAG: cation:proton antiporter, partial [Verrucomicrobiota bacterium]